MIHLQLWGLVDGPTTERTLKKLNPEAYARYQQFAKRLQKKIKHSSKIIMLIRKVKRIQMAEYYPALHDAYLHVSTMVPYLTLIIHN